MTTPAPALSAPAPTAAAVPHPVTAAGPPHWEPGQSAPLSFDEFSALYRMDPDRYQIYQQQWYGDQQTHSIASSSTQPPPPPPPPHSSMSANHTTHPTPSSLAVTLQLSSSSPPAHNPPLPLVPHSGKSFADTLSNPAPPAAVPAVAAVEQLSGFARDLARGSLVECRRVGEPARLC